MKHLILCLCLTPFFIMGEPTLLLNEPDVYNSDIIFEYGGDIWRVSLFDKSIQRLTSHEGYEIRPEFSPDGKWIAYSGQYHTDNYDVYIMPTAGGEPKQLTYHPSSDLVVGWTPEGKYVLFVSGRGDWKLRRLYKISTEGGLPEKIPLPSVYEADMSPDGDKLVFNRRHAQLAWRGYRGGRTSDIWLHDFKKDTTYKIIDWEGTEIYPQWCDNRIYFLADKDGRMNIYSYDFLNNETRQITEYTDFDIQNMNKGGEKIVYTSAGRLWMLDITTESIDTINISVPDDKRFFHPHYEAVAKLIESYDISPTGKRAVFVARGEIFTIPKEKGPVANITKTPGIRERNATWSPDGKWIAYFSDKTDEHELYIMESRGNRKPIQLTYDGDCYRWGPSWSPDSKKLLYADSKYRLLYVDIEDRKPVLIDTSSMSPIYSNAWSPDSRWIAYIKLNDNWFGSIYFYSLSERKSYKITTDFFDDDGVCFDPSGKYLYFISSRTFSPAFDKFSELKIYPRSSNICLITLQADEPSPFLPESDEEEIEENEEEDEMDKDNDKKKRSEDVKIDFKNINQRIMTIPVPAGLYFNLSASGKKVLYMARIKVDISNRKYNLHVYDLKEKEDNILLKNINGYVLSSDGEFVLYKGGDTYGIVEIKDKGAKVGDGKLKTQKMEMKIDRKAELNQMFADAWRLQRDFYYDPNMHGLDWPKLRGIFSQFLPHIADRDDLTRIISWLYSELGGSHAYVWSSQDNRKKVSVGVLGAEFELHKNSGLFKFKKILKGESWQEDRKSPLTEPGVVINEGEYLISIEDEPVKYPDNPYKFLENTVGKQIRIKVNDRPDSDGAREVRVIPIAHNNEGELYYLDWVEKNRKKVDDATNGKVGYVHVPNTATWGLEEFGKYFFSQAAREGLIIDVRYNRGGWSPDMFMNYLQRRPLGQFVRRVGKPYIEPFVKFEDRLVCVINEYAGSGGDMFPYFFRELGLGPLIGNRTWGGLIATNGRRLMDGGGVATPVSRFKDMSGVWRIENEGVAPDIQMDDHPDKIRKGIDPQLEKAIKVIKEKL